MQAFTHQNSMQAYTGRAARATHESTPNTQQAYVADTKRVSGCITSKLNNESLVARMPACRCVCMRARGYAYACGHPCRPVPACMRTKVCPGCSCALCIGIASTLRAYPCLRVCDTAQLSTCPTHPPRSLPSPLTHSHSHFPLGLTRAHSLCQGSEARHGAH